MVGRLGLLARYLLFAFILFFSRRDRLSIDSVVQCFREHETTKESRQSIEKDDNYVEVPLCSPC